MKKSAAITIICVLAAAAAGLGALSLWQNGELARARRINELYGEHALSRLETSLYAMDSALRRSQYATDPALLSQLCGEAAANADAALTAMEGLPCVTHELERLSGAVNTAGDYAMAVARAASRGGVPDERTASELSALGNTVSGLAGDVTEIRQALADNALELDDYAECADGGRTNTVGWELRQLEAALPSPSALSYDGRYASADAGEKGENVTESQARQSAAEFLDLPAQRLISHGLSDGGRPLWWFTVSVPGGEEQRIGVDGATGAVAEWSACQAPAGGELSEDEVLSAAEAFLEARGLTELTAVGVEREGGLAVVSFAGRAGEALRLSALCSLAVDTGSGQVCAYAGPEPSEPPENAAAEITPEQAGAGLPPSLTPQGARLVTIRSAGGGAEKLCWELACLTAESGAVTVYVDAITGGQEKIEIGGT